MVYSLQYYSAIFYLQVWLLHGSLFSSVPHHYIS
jgi:hypothetical protein